MRALVVSPTLPWPLDAGGRLRTTNLLRELATRHEITLWCVRQEGADADAVAALRALGLTLRVFPRAKRGLLQRLGAPPQESWFWSPALSRALRELPADAFDVVHIDELCQVRALPERGWTLLARPEDLPVDTPPTLVAERDERMVTLVFLPNEQGGGASAAVFDAR